MSTIFCRACNADEPALVSILHDHERGDVRCTLVYRCGVRLIVRMTDEELANLPDSEFIRIFSSPAALAEYVRERWDQSLDALPSRQREPSPDRH